MPNGDIISLTIMMQPPQVLYIFCIWKQCHTCLFKLFHGVLFAFIPAPWLCEVSLVKNHISIHQKIIGFKNVHMVLTSIITMEIIRGSIRDVCFGDSPHSNIKQQRNVAKHAKSYNYKDYVTLIIDLNTCNNRYLQITGKVCLSQGTSVLKLLSSCVWRIWKVVWQLPEKHNTTYSCPNFMWWLMHLGNAIFYFKLDSEIVIIHSLQANDSFHYL